MPVQTAYANTLTAAVLGQVADMSLCDISSHVLESASAGPVKFPLIEHKFEHIAARCNNRLNNLAVF